MGEPNAGHLKYYPGSDGAPSAGGLPYGGAIDTDAELSESTPENLIKGLQIPALGEAHLIRFGAAYRKLEEGAGGSIEEAAFYNRAGAITNSAQGVAQVVSTSTADVGAVRIVAKEGGDWDPEEIQADGTTTATGENMWDLGTFRRAEYLDGVDGSPAVPEGNVSVSINGELVAVIFGSDSGYGNYMASAEVKVAVASAKDSTVGGVAWGSAAAGVGTYELAVYWEELGDTSIPIPGDVLEDGEYCGFSIRVEMEDGIPRPRLGKLQIDVDVKGRAVA